MSNLLKPYNEQMMDVLLYIQKNLDQPLSPEELAAAACFSVVHFHRIFKGMIGESLKEHIRRLRLEKAAYMLCYTDESVINIALTAQYESPETFSRAFKKMFTVPPSDYRRTTRKLTSPSNPNVIYYSPEPTSMNINFDQSSPTIQLDVRERNEIYVAFVRHVGSYFEVGKAWEKLCNWAGPTGLLDAQTEFMGLCYDDPSVTPQGKIRYDACISTSKELTAEGDIGIQTIPGGKYAVATHCGSYDGLEEAYKQLYGKWLPASGHQLRDSIPSFEKYLNTPAETAPEDLITEIYLAIN
ncbi:AraC family transcriptional regulator [Maridesulfovibrio frigidus]|uniref:AraC family transcriptional regulator n=1 Tax=Maridesulfovibrio frigidus TaxID=340956 RepID=UPI0004E15BC9|nr:AraC family transcriptional regulator [Maridesulfovibrio frigidus]